MKRFFPALISAVALISCTKTTFEETADRSSIFTASTEIVETKTTLDGTKVRWSEGDLVSVFAGTNINDKYIVSESSVGKTYASFERVSGSSDGFTAGTKIPANVAYYPYSKDIELEWNSGQASVQTSLPSVQNYAQSSFGPGAYPLMAATEDSSEHNFAFKNVCGVLKLQLVGNARVKTIEFHGNGDEVICGSAEVSISADTEPEIQMTGNGTTVTLDCGDGVELNQEPTEFCIVLPPTVFSNGFTVTVTEIYGGTLVIKTTKKQTVTRSGILKMPAKEMFADYKDGSANGFDYVDLGLPSGTLWASMNVGADEIESFGDYFIWGATEPLYEPGYAQENPQAHWKSKYSEGYVWNNTPYQAVTSPIEADTKWSKYLGSTASPFKDGTASDVDAVKIILDPSDDAASVILGSCWRMPTIEEWQELKKVCSWEWSSVNGVEGCKVTSSNGKWIFLPAAGYRYGLQLNKIHESGYYWSSSVNPDEPSDALEIHFYSDYNSRGSSGRRDGLTIRPVYSSDPSEGVTGISLDKSSETISVNDKLTIVASVTAKEGSVNTQVQWSSSDPSVASVDFNGVVTAMSAGAAVITATTVFCGYSASCEIIVSSDNVFESVDLGLSVKWATMNVGATKPEEYGDYFAWAATEPWYEPGYAQESPQTHWKSGYSDGYTWSNTPYQTANLEGSSSTKWSKYLGSTTTSYKDPSATDADALLKVLRPEDDAASVNWGGSWRMPTDDEWNELRSGCTWTWSSLNGTNGYKVTSKKSGYTDKWIFLPAAGSWDNTTFSGLDSYGSYWTSSLYTGYPNGAYEWGFSSKLAGLSDRDYRYYGRSVRPVTE